MPALDDGITTGPSRLFLWMVLLIGILVSVIVGFNITTYKTIADSNKTIDDVTPDRARALMWINIIAIVIIIFGCLWALYKIIMENAVVRVYKEKAVEYGKEKYQGLRGYATSSPTYGPSGSYRAASPAPSASPMSGISSRRMSPQEVEMSSMRMSSEYEMNPFRQ